MGCVTSRISEPEPQKDDTPSSSAVSSSISTDSSTSHETSEGDSISDSAVVIDLQLQKEAAEEANHNVTFDFNDVLDEKHMKYMDRYTADEEFWGIGIENETYLVLPERHGAASFRSLKQKPERYSVTYTTNFKPAPLQAAIEALGAMETLRYPVYVNAHTFQKTDPSGHHRTFYDANGTPNPTFTESIHDVLMRECGEYRDTYDTAVVFDGDTIEFITQRFYRGTVTDTVRELEDVKRRWLAAVAPRLTRMTGIRGAVAFPEYNHGLVTFLTTRRANLGICNSGTLHVNLTLPTLLRESVIVDKDAFAKSHLAFIHHIQLLEPLFAACYGTPDVFSLVDPSYSLGSLRLSRSRYVSLQSFNPTQPVNGKLLLGPKPASADFWYNRIADGPYFLNATIGYDINFNKFKNHGVEIRFFDWFPEQYLTDVVNVFVLLAAHSQSRLSYVFNRTRYADVVVQCVRRGFATRLSAAEVKTFLSDLDFPLHAEGSAPLPLLQRIADELYDRYKDHDLVQKLSPHMTRPVLVDYNREAHRLLVRDVFGPKKEIVIRCEENPHEARAPLAPSEVALLAKQYSVAVETSAARCYSDADYKAAGARIVPRGYWCSTRESVVLGLKAIAATPHPSQTLMHFAHCFKGQEGSAMLLKQLSPCRFIDYEYMRNNGQRVLSFCAQSGKIGCYLALMAYHLRDKEIGLPRFSEKKYREMLQAAFATTSASPSNASAACPSILLIGHGTAGKAAKSVLDQLDLACTVWNSKTMCGRSAAEIREAVREFEVVIHAIRLPDGSAVIPPFLLPEDLDSQVTVVCDISCDLGNPRNTLPIYTHYTSESSPIQRIGGVSLIAIPNLPSLEPVVSTKQFSEQLIQFLPAVMANKSSVEIDGAEMVFRERLAALELTPSCVE